MQGWPKEEVEAERALFWGGGGDRSLFSRSEGERVGRSRAKGDP